MRALVRWFGELWTVARSPAAAFSLGVLSLGGFVGGAHELPDMTGVQPRWIEPADIVDTTHQVR